MTTRAFRITLLISMGWMIALTGGFFGPGVSEAMPLNAVNSSLQPYPEQKRFLVAHLEGDERDGDDGHKRDCERKSYKSLKSRKGKCRPLKKLEVNKRHELKFGAIVSNRTGETRVVIDPVTGNKTVFAGVDLGGSSGPAVFEVEGQPNRRFVVTLPRQIVMTGKAGKGHQVTELIAYLPSNRGPKSRNGDGSAFGYLGNDGKAKLFVGGTMLFGPRQPVGKFKAPFDVIVDYVP